MLKKIDNYLLTHYPLIWNTKVVWVLPVCIIIHLMFFFSGYFENISYSYLHDLRLYASEEIIMFSLLISILLIIIWLVFYLRNNAFKQHLPYSRKKLFAEFSIIFIILFSSINFFDTQLLGKYLKVQRYTAGTDLVEEANTTNLALFFLPFHEGRFHERNSCSHIDEMSEFFNRFYIVHPGDEENLHEYSYLNYCQNQVFLESKEVRSNYENRAIATRWLFNHDKDSIKFILHNFFMLLEKYNANYQFDVDAHIESIFSNADFSNMRFIPTDRFENSRENYQFIEQGIVISSLRNIHKARIGYLHHSRSIQWVILTLAFSLALFSFRIVRAKEWFIALISAGLLIVLGVLISAIIYKANHENVFLLFALLILFSTGCAIFFIRSKHNKRFAGVNLVLTISSFVWFIPFWLIFLDEKLHAFHPVSVYLKNNSVLIGYLNISISLVLLGIIFIPLAYKWQGNPEE